MKFKSILFILCFALAPLFAQSFGQNKVQSERFIWRMIQTRHFDIYFYQHEDFLAQYAANHVEQMYARVSKLIGHHIQNRVPIILHDTHARFEQTNVIRMPLPEAIGGFTEIFKNRIVLPFDGSYSSLRHVLQHEMVHAVMFDYMRGTGGAMSIVGKMSKVPLWFNEGLAEYGSLEWDVNSDFFMLDAVTQDYAQSPVQNFQGFLAYKGGQSFLYFLAETFGEKSISKIIQNIHRGYSFDIAFKLATQTSLEELGEIWLRQLRSIYWPELGTREMPKKIARRLTDHRKDMSFYNLSPTLSPDGKQVAFFSGRGDREGVWILDMKTEKVVRTAFEGGGSGSHESFHPFSSGMAWAPDSRRMLLVSKRDGHDVLEIIDTKKQKVLKTFDPGLSTIQFPNWSRDGKKIIFASSKNAVRDLMLLDPETGKTEQLTFGKTAEDRPVFSPSGKFVVYESDSLAGDVPYNRKLKTDLFRMNLKTKKVERMIDSRWDSKMPAFGQSDSLLMYVSNESGVDNIYLKNLNTDSTYQVTNLLSGVTQPSWGDHDSLLVFTLFEYAGWDLFVTKEPLQKLKEKTLAKTRFIKSALDSNVSFFDSLALENLSSYRDTTKMDSLAKDSLHQQYQLHKRRPRIEEDDLFVNNSIEDTATLFTEDTTVDLDTAEIFDSVKVKNQNGEYITRPYKSDWSLDQAVALAGLDNINGLAGQGMLVFSDLMGDQEFSFWFDNQGQNIDKTNLFLGYDYLPYRVDFGLQFYHTFYSTGDSRYYLPMNIFEDRTIGLGTRLQYPFSRYSRIRLDAEGTWRGRGRLGYNGEKYVGVTGPSEDTLMNLQGDLSWTFDNAQWGITGPINGTRAQISVSGVPGWMQTQYGFGKVEADLRQYFRFFKKYTFATRFSGGISQSVPGYVNPHRFLLGGVNATFTSRISTENYDRFAGNRGERLFATLDSPLRGFDLLDFRGTRKALANIEFRYPFIREFSIVWPIPIALRYVTGVLFMDMGGAWSTGDAWSQMGQGYGWGMRANLGVFVLRYTKAWSNNDFGALHHSARTYWSLGAEF